MLTINLVFILRKSVNYSVNLCSNRNMNSAIDWLIDWLIDCWMLCVSVLRPSASSSSSTTSSTTVHSPGCSTGVQRSSCSQPILARLRLRCPLSPPTRTVSPHTVTLVKISWWVQHHSAQWRTAVVISRGTRANTIPIVKNLLQRMGTAFPLLKTLKNAWEQYHVTEQYM